MSMGYCAYVMNDFSPHEQRAFARLSTPAKIQDFLNSLPFHIVPDNDTCLSPRGVLAARTAQCMEGAMFAAVALRYHGRKPLVLDLTADKDDADHVVAVFQERGCWGAISKTNHAVLRYREPVYRTIRELVMSYFHEYFLENGKKTLRSYSRPVNLSRFDSLGWMTSNEPVWYIPEYLVDVRHYPILTAQQQRGLRPADALEIAAGKLSEAV